MDNIHITQNGVLKLLSNLNIHKAAGPDEIPTRLLIELISIFKRRYANRFTSLVLNKSPESFRICTYSGLIMLLTSHRACTILDWNLHNIFPSINQGTIPPDWKEAFVVPIFKKGDKSCASNYRPVSLTVGTPFWVIWILSMHGCVLCPLYGMVLISSLLVKTEENWQFKILAFFSLSEYD
jgi:hypothetical protein